MGLFALAEGLSMGGCYEVCIQWSWMSGTVQ